MKVINLFGGPGVGKSTLAARLFDRMKIAGKRVELVTEFAKGLVYAGDNFDLSNQLYMLSQQDRQLYRLLGKVDYAITDSPLPLGLLYVKGRCDAPWFTQAVLEVFNSYDNVNYLVERMYPYQPYGRYQTEAEAKEIDIKLMQLLLTHNIPFLRYQEITP